MSEAATAPARPDRAAAVRAALRRLVARHGFHGASMGAVAAEAGVATGTAYVHYASKDELVVGAYLESKQRLGEAAADAVDPGAEPAERFRAIWSGTYRHLAADPDEARFLIQVESSPYVEAAHAAAAEGDEGPLSAAAAAPDMAPLLLPLPPEVLYELAMAPAVRLAARGTDLSPPRQRTVADACWRAITRP